MLASGALFAKLFADAATGDATLDAISVRGRIVAAALRVYGPLTMTGPQGTQIVRALMALANNEYDRRRPLDAQIGDTTSSHGPSVGFIQVSRDTAVELGLWSPPADADDDPDAIREAYALEASNLWTVTVWGVRVFRAKVDAADGDLATGIRKYNGSGPRAEAYRAKALAFADATWGEGALS